MNRPISKRAGLEEGLKQYIMTVWKADRGPFENIFRIAPFAMLPFMGSLGSVFAIILTNIAGHILGISPADFGRELDRYFSLGPGDDPREAGVMPKLKDLIDNLIDKSTPATASAEDRPISKTAGLWTLLVKSGQIGRLIVAAIMKVIGVLSSVFVFSHLSDLYEELSNPAREKVTDLFDTETGAEKETEKDTTGMGRSVGDMADYIEQKYGLK